MVIGIWSAPPPMISMVSCARAASLHRDKQTPSAAMRTAPPEQRLGGGVRADQVCRQSFIGANYSGSILHRFSQFGRNTQVQLAQLLEQSGIARHRQRSSGVDRALDRGVIGGQAARLLQLARQHLSAGDASSMLYSPRALSGIAGRHHHLAAGCVPGCAPCQRLELSARAAAASACWRLRASSSARAAGRLRQLLLLLQDRRAPRFGFLLQPPLLLAPRLLEALLFFLALWPLLACGVPPAARCSSRLRCSSCFLARSSSLAALLLLALLLFCLRSSSSLRCASSAAFFSCSLRCFSLSSISASAGLLWRQRLRARRGLRRRRRLGRLGGGGGCGLWSGRAAAAVPARRRDLGGCGFGGGSSLHSSATSGSRRLALPADAEHTGSTKKARWTATASARRRRVRARGRFDSSGSSSCSLPGPRPGEQAHLR